MATRTVQHDPAPLTADLVRDLLYRRDVALARHRLVLARSLGLADVEMTAVVHLVHRHELTTSQLRALLELSSGGASALVQRLERADVVRRRPHPGDRRSALISLTRAVAQRLARAEAEFHGALTQAAYDLSDDERVAVGGFLTRLAELTEDMARPSPDARSSRRNQAHRPVPSLWG